MFSFVIKQYLDANGIKYTFLADGLGMPMNVLSALLNNKRKMAVEEYFKICEILHVDAKYFVDRIAYIQSSIPNEATAAGEQRGRG